MKQWIVVLEMARRTKILHIRCAAKAVIGAARGTFVIARWDRKTSVGLRVQVEATDYEMAVRGALDFMPELERAYYGKV